MHGHFRVLHRILCKEFGDRTWPLRGVEVGVAHGITSRALLRRLPTLYLTMVDPWLPAGAKRRSTWEAAERDMQRAVDSTAFAESRRRIWRTTSEEAVKRFGHAELDFVYVDGDHTYAAVVNDIRWWWEKVRPGGLLCGHDYWGLGDQKGLFGVKQAVDEWVKERNLKLRLHPATLWSIKRPV